jgi:hypothetical protein
VTTLRELLASKASIGDIAGYLDGLDSAAREAESLTLDGREQAAIWERAADGPVITIDHFVPKDVAPNVAVRHPGRNTIPVPRHFQLFAKVFSRDEKDPRLCNGYNDSNAWFIRPGYFVAYATAGNSEWERRGGVVVDYLRVPDGNVPAGWPKVVPNQVGLQRLVYFRTRDFMRRVSAHMSIGRAAEQRDKGDRELDFWFTLCRRDASK